ncbi:LPS export ABC transporter permease LptF [Desulfocicer vacuolatum]|uniref:LPS export ABC transporter permease LptF n=1 Tax=Desulfocicer vacuolatum TaxID=2298 RepID=UPI001E487DE6|nr:LPS export ABC transporter permease LptF [Desulfocicer vacuolatum]
MLYRYIFRELVSPFGVSLLFLTFVFVMTRIPDITNMVVNYNMGISAVFSLVLYSLPRFMEFTLPMSVMIAVLLTFMRMSGANEIIALKGGGMSIYRLLPPVAFFCTLMTLITLWVTVWAVPWGKHAFTVLGQEMARANINVALKERQFNTPFDNVMIYVSAIDIKTARLKDVFIEDGRDPDSVNITVAAQGALVSRPNEGIYTLTLENGIINQVSLDRSAAHQIQFDRYDINFDVGLPDHKQRIDKKDLDEMGIRELLTVARDGKQGAEKRHEARMELHEKLAIPFACLALGLLALPLGLQSLSARHAPGFGLALFFFMGYYMLLALGWSAGGSGGYPPGVAMWLPNCVMGGTAIYLIKQVAGERFFHMPHLFILRKRER